MNDRPDLPGLERVTSRGVMDRSPVLLILGTIAAMVWLVVAMFLVTFHHQRRDVVAWTLAIVLASLLLQLLWDWVRLSLRWSWRTDEQGIRASGLLGMRALGWAEVEQACIRRLGPIRGTRLVLTSGSEDLLIPTGDFRLVASVWQHLRRVKISSSIQVPKEAEAYWRAVPDTVPREMALDTTPPTQPLRSLLPSIVMGVAWLALVVAVLSDSASIRWQESVWLLFFTLLVALKVSEPFIAQTARRVNARSDALEADTLFGHAIVTWTDVKSVHWVSRVSVSRTHRQLRLGLGRHRALRIPWDPGDMHSVRLVLAVIRQVRSANPGLLVPIPDDVPVDRVPGERAGHRET